MSDDTIEMNTKGLDQLIKSLKGQLPVIKIGILGDKNGRTDSNTNANIGVKHEFGDQTVPRRSFLRQPITENLQKYLEDSDAFTEDTLKEVARSGSIILWMKKIAIIAETIVSDAFNTGGFGKWKPSNMLFKKNHQTLVETQQLRNSITSDVK